jgi:hypothetical protein
MEAKVRCNICGTNIDASKIEEHKSIYVPHHYRKDKLEKILKEVRKSKSYIYNDSSVIAKWKNSL